MKLPNFNQTSINLSLTRISKYEYDNNYEYAIFSRGFNLAIKKVVQMFGGKKKMEAAYKSKHIIDNTILKEFNDRINLEYNHKKLNETILIRNWFRTTGDLSEDAKTITYSTDDIENFFKQIIFKYNENS